MSNKNTMIVIPARLNSKRLPAKILAEIHGKPMIYWVAMRALSSELARVIVATDSEEVISVCKSHNIPATLTSDKCENGTERVFEVSRQFPDMEYFINIQGDEPLINVEVIREMMGVEVNKWSFYTAISKISLEENNPSEIKVALGENDRIRFASRSLIPYFRDTQGVRYKIHGVYLYSKEILSKYVSYAPGELELSEAVEQLRCIERDIPIYGVKTSTTERSVDTMDDLQYMRNIPFSHYVLAK
jgi:3-deoxy-D-manno-octulosonate cytidylyltransferase